MAALPDNDPQETNEWLDALDGVLQHEGPERAHFILEQLIEKARCSSAWSPGERSSCPGGMVLM